MRNRVFVIFATLYILLQSGSLCSQASWEIFAGPSYTNVRHIQNHQQIVYNHTTNAPLWNVGFQFGINTELYSTSRTALKTGLAIQLKGDRKSRHVIFPEEDYYGIRFLYLSLPVHFHYKLLKSENIYVYVGFSGEVLIHQNQINSSLSYFPIQSFGDRLGLSTQVGIRYDFEGKFAFALNYSQYLTNIYVTESVREDGNDIKYRHQGFELMFIYKL